MAEPGNTKLFSLRPLQFSLGRKGRSRPPSVVTSLDIDGQILRVVQATARGSQPTVTRVAVVPLELPSDAERSDPAIMGRAIAKALTQVPFKPGPVVMGISRAQVVLRTLTLPVIESLPELASMVHFQLGRDLPFRMEDAVVDFKVRGKITVAASRNDPSSQLSVTLTDVKGELTPVTKLEVLVAAVRREVVEFHLQLAETAGLRLKALGLLPYANARCVEACKVAEGGQAFALVSLRPDEVNIDVIAEQALLFSRGAVVRPWVEPTLVSGAADSATEKSPAVSDVATPPVLPPSEQARMEAFLEAVTIEVVRTIHSYSGIESGNPVSKVVVTGAMGQETAVVEALSKRLGRPCALLDPASALDLPGQAREQTAGAIAAIGLALGCSDPQGLPFDFLNPKQPAVPRDLGRIRILAGIAAVTAVMVFVLVIRNYLINDRTRINREVAAQVAEAEKSRPIYKRMMQQAAMAEDWGKTGPEWLEHYAYLSAVLPPSDETFVNSVAVSGQGSIRLAVQARSGEILAKLDKQLRAAGYDVKPLAITPGADRNGYEFRSNVELQAPEKLRIDLTKLKAPAARPSDDGSLDPIQPRGGGG